MNKERHKCHRGVCVCGPEKKLNCAPWATPAPKMKGHVYTAHFRPHAIKTTLSPR